MKNITLVEDYDLFSLGWTSPYVSETLFINIAWTRWKWNKIENIPRFIVGMVNFESIQNTLRRIGLLDAPLKLDDLIDKHPELLGQLDLLGKKGN